jgi:protein SCO1/2
MGRRAVEFRRRLPGRVAWILSTVTLVACTGGEGRETGSVGGLRGTPIEPPLEKPDFVLTDVDGKPWDFRAETDGKLTLLFFGYTNCPDVCPVHMGNLGAVIAKYPFETRDRIRVVFVTTDPARDTPDRLRSWLGAFGGGIIGLRGDIAEVNRIQAELGLPPAALPDSAEALSDYPVGHSARVLAFTPDNLGRVAYPFGTRQEDWVRDLPALLKQRDG